MALKRNTKSFNFFDKNTLEIIQVYRNIISKSSNLNEIKPKSQERGKTIEKGSDTFSKQF